MHEDLVIYRNNNTNCLMAFFLICYVLEIISYQKKHHLIELEAGVRASRFICGEIQW